MIYYHPKRAIIATIFEYVSDINDITLLFDCGHPMTGVQNGHKLVRQKDWFIMCSSYTASRYMRVTLLEDSERLIV